LFGSVPTVPELLTCPIPRGPVVTPAARVWSPRSGGGVAVDLLTEAMGGWRFAL
jgi:hypothetical protein